MLDNHVFKPVKKWELDPGTKVIDSTWACKKKGNGTLRGRLVVRGFKQVEGMHYDSSDIHAPVTNAVTIRIVFTLFLMAGNWIFNVVDVEGAFLHGRFKQGEEVHISIPEGWEEFYDDDDVLLLGKTLYGTKQVAMAFWRELLNAMKKIKKRRSKADPCLYYEWTKYGLCLIVLWIDDNLIVGPPEAVAEAKAKFMKLFKCKDLG